MGFATGGEQFSLGAMEIQIGTRTRDNSDDLVATTIRPVNASAATQATTTTRSSRGTPVNGS